MRPTSPPEPRVTGRQGRERSSGGTRRNKVQFPSRHHPPTRNSSVDPIYSLTITAGDRVRALGGRGPHRGLVGRPLAGRRARTDPGGVGDGRRLRTDGGTPDTQRERRLHGTDGDTALHLAALYGHTQCVEMLLGAGANVAVRDADGGTPLHDACAGGFEEIVGMLLAAAGPAGASEVANARDGDDETPLHMAARGGYPGIVRMLLAAGAQGGRQVSRGALSLELRGRRVRAARAAAEVRMNSTNE